jgi:hypothetical protein
LPPDWKCEPALKRSASFQALSLAGFIAAHPESSFSLVAIRRIPIGPEIIGKGDRIEKQANCNCAISSSREKTVTMIDIAQTTVTRTSGAERMKLHRERKRNGMRCLTIELRETEIDALVAKQFLKPEMRDDREAIADAIYGWFEQVLV